MLSVIFLNIEINSLLQKCSYFKLPKTKLLKKLLEMQRTAIKLLNDCFNKQFNFS